MQLIIPLFYLSAGIAFLAAIQSGILAMHKPRTLILLVFSLISLLIFGYQGVSALYYQADSVATAAVYLQWQFAFICITSPVAIFFLGRLTGDDKLAGVAFIIAAIPYILLLAINAFSPYSARFITLQMESPMVFPWGEQLAHFGGIANPWRHLFTLVNIGFLIWLTWRIRVISKKKRIAEHHILLVLTIMLYVAGIWGALIDYGIIHSIYLTGFVFTIFALMMIIRYGFLLKQLTSDLLRANHEILTFSLVADQSPSSLIITDLGGIIEYANPSYCKTSGYSCEEVVGVHSRHLKSEKHPPELYKELWQTISSGNIWKGELINKKKNGGLYLEEVTIYPIFDENNSIIRYIGVKNEITEKRRNDKKRQQDKRLELIGQLTGGVAHEVRNPLNAILANTEALFREKEFVGKSDLAPYQYHIRTQVTRLSRLMNDLLDLGRTIPQTSLVAINPLDACSGAIFLLRSSSAFSDRRIRLDEHFYSAKAMVKADSDRLQQVLLNLLENACQHSSPDSEVVVQVFPKDDKTLCFRIQDSGPGISHDQLSLIFNPFFTKRHGGTGLGLTIAKHYTEAMGGTLTLSNNEPPPGCSAELQLQIY